MHFQTTFDFPSSSSVAAAAWPFPISEINSAAAHPA
jgi:hypothetical protein